MQYVAVGQIELFGVGVTNVTFMFKYKITSF